MIKPTTKGYTGTIRRNCSLRMLWLGLLVQPMAQSFMLVSYRARSHHDGTAPAVMVAGGNSAIGSTTSTPFAQPFRLFMSNSSSSSSATDDLAALRVSAIRQQLQDLNIDFSDCFDKESLIVRLKDANDGTVSAKETPSTTASSTKNSPDQTENTAVSESPPKAETTTQSSSTSTTTTTEPSPADMAAILEKIRAMKVRALREELASYRIRWAGLLEKEDLVQAVLQARVKASTFSASGKVHPGQVADLPGTELQQEIEFRSGGAATPMLVDVYAVWCGPCKVMAEQLVQAAADIGDGVRFVKMDSDKHPDMAGKLKVQGLPTLVLFQNGEEVDRIEGALMKDQLIDWVNSKI